MHVVRGEKGFVTCLLCSIASVSRLFVGLYGKVRFCGYFGSGLEHSSTCSFHSIWEKKVVKKKRQIIHVWVSKSPPEGDMNVCPKLNGNSFSR